MIDRKQKIIYSFDISELFHFDAQLLSIIFTSAVSILYVLHHKKLSNEMYHYNSMSKFSYNSLRNSSFFFFFFLTALYLIKNAVMQKKKNSFFLPSFFLSTLLTMTIVNVNCSALYFWQKLVFYISNRYS